MPPASTVESAFVVLDRASGPIKGIKREVKGLRLEAERAGSALDSVAGPKELEELKAFSTEARGLASAFRDVKTEVRQANPSLLTYTTRLRSADHETKKLTRSTNLLAASLERVNAIDARPRVQVDGIAESRAEVAALRRELRGLGAAHPTATVGVRRGGSVGAPAGGLTRGAAQGAGGSGLRSVGAGPFSMRPGSGLALYAAGLPIAQSVGGAAGAGGAALAGAGLGAGAIGLTGYAVAASGVGALAAVAVPAARGLKELTTAQQRYNESIADYGRKSKEAARARWELHQAEAAAPGGARGFVQQRAGLGQDWQRATRPGQSALFGAGAQFLGGVRRRTPFLAGQSNRVARSAARQGGQFGEFLLAPEQMRTVRALTNAFAGDLKFAENTAEHLVTTFSNISRASLPFFHEGAKFVDHWTGGWASSTSDIQATRKQIGSYVEDLRTVTRVVGHAADLTRDLFEPARGPGRGMLQDLDSTLVRMDKWAERNPDKIRGFFSDAVDDTEKLAQFLGVAVEELHKLADVLSPIVGGFAQLASIGGGAGLLLPTALRMGAGQVVSRGAGRGTGPSAGPGASSVAPMLLGGAAAMGSSALIAGAAGPAGARSAIPMGPGYDVERRQRLQARRVAAGLPPTRGALGYGAPLNAGWLAPRQPSALLGQARSGLGAAGGAAARGLGRGAGAAGRFGGPLLLISGALGAAESEGGLDVRAANALSGATLGLIPRQLSGDEFVDKGAAQQRERLERLPTDGNLGTLRSNRDRIQAELDRQREMLGDTGGPVRYLKPGERRTVADSRLVKGRISVLEEALTGTNSDISRAQVGLGQQSREHGASLADSLQASFGTRMHRGPKAGRESRQEALGSVLGAASGKMSTMRPEGAEVLGEGMLSWAKDRAGSNKGMLAEVDRFANRIEKRFSRMGEHIEIVDGQILKGTRSEWREIGRALSDPAEVALERVTSAFTEIQRQAVGSLMAMGYSRSEANALVKAQETGGKKGFTNVQAGISAQKGDTGASRAATPARAATGPSASKAFSPLGTAGPFGDGPGMDLASRAAPSGRVGGQAVATAGSLMGADSGLMPYAELGAQYGNRVTSGFRPGSITTSGNLSFHASKHALDMAGGDMRGLASTLYTRYGPQLEELITPWPELNLKNGQPFKYDATIEAQHKDHVHVADVDPPAGLAGLAGGASFAFSPDTAGPGLMNISLTAPGSGIAGAPGALADAASGLYAAGLSQMLNGLLGSAVPPAGLSGSTSAPGAAGAGGDASQIRAAFGLPPIFDDIRYAESRNDPNALNPSGASGFYQIMMPLHAKLVQRAAATLNRAANVFDKQVNTMVAKMLYDEAGLSPWTASKGMWAKAGSYGDGIGRMRSKLKLAGDGAGAAGGSGGSTVVQMTAQVNAGMGRAELRSEFSKFADQIYDEIVSGAEKRPRAMA